MLKKTYLIVALVLVTALAAGATYLVMRQNRQAVSSSPHGESAGAAPQFDPAPVIPVRVGVVASADVLPLWVAEDRGLLAEAGLESVEVITFSDKDELLAAYGSKSIDAAIVGLVDAVELESGARPVTALTVTSDPTSSALPNVLVVADEFLLTLGGSETMSAIGIAWNAAVAVVEEDRDAAAELLAAKAPGTRLHSSYPKRAIPAQSQVDQAIEQAGLAGDVTYESLLLVLPQ